MNENKDDLLLKHVKKEEIATRKIGGETLLVPIRGRLAEMRNLFMLNPVAEFIWDRLEQDRTSGSILDDIVDEFEVDRQVAENDLLALVRRLKALELISGAK